MDRVRWPSLEDTCHVYRSARFDGCTQLCDPDLPGHFLPPRPQSPLALVSCPSLAALAQHPARVWGPPVFTPVCAPCTFVRGRLGRTRSSCYSWSCRGRDHDRDRGGVPLWLLTPRATPVA